MAFTTKLGEAGFDDITAFAGNTDSDCERARGGSGAEILKRAALNLVFALSESKL